MSRNPFDDDEEPGAFGSGRNGGMRNGDSTWIRNQNPVRNDMYSLQTQLEDSHARTKASQQRALASIANSERIGVETAAELLEQGEKLSRAEQKLDAITEMQKDSQKHINTMSSVFGGIKNFFSRKQSTPSAASEAKIANVRSDGSGNAGSKLRDPTFSDPSWSSNLLVQENTTPNKFNDVEFERNLNLMSDGMSRLKGLAQGLNEELRMQNEQLDRMTPRVDSVTNTMVRQNQQMNKLLGIKPK